MRYVSGNAVLQPGAGPGASNAPLNTALTAGEAVSAGQIAVQRSDGLVYGALEQNLPGSSLRPITNPTPITNGLQSPVTLYGSGHKGRIAATVLKNGNVVIVSCSSVVPYNILVSIISPAGAVVVPMYIAGQANFAGGTGDVLPAVCELKNGGFVVAFNGNGHPGFAIFAENGTLVLPQTLVSPGAGSGLFALSIAPLSNGNFALCWNSYNGANIETPYYSVYSSTGVLVKDKTVLRVNNLNLLFCVASAICSLQGGGFVCVYHTSDGQINSNYFSRFDNSGAIQGVETMVRAGVVSRCSVIARTFGAGFFLVESDSVRVTTWNAAGAQFGPAIAHEPGFNCPKVSANSNVDYGIVGWTQGTLVKVSPIYLTGPGAGYATPSTAAAPGCDTQVICDPSSGGINAVLFSDASGKAVVATLDGAYFTKSVNGYPTFPLDLGGASPNSGFLVFVVNQYKNEYPTFIAGGKTVGDQIYFAVINSFVPACRPVGVFSASAAKSANVSVQISGIANLSQRFAQPYTLPGTATVTGGKWFVLGNTLVMGEI